mgnify:CR=1 FL=1
MTPDEPRRPDPDALLAATRAQRGRLKVFLGMSPGVGKTYEMLKAARREAAKDGDVVVGVVETHGRKVTQSLLRGLEVMPRAPIDYRGATLMEFDLDAALARRPGLLLVDEYAHSNAPSAGRTSKKCWPPASASGPLSTSSTSKASSTWSPRSPACASARRCPTSPSPRPTRSS